MQRALTEDCELASIQISIICENRNLYRSHLNLGLKKHFESEIWNSGFVNSNFGIRETELKRNRIKEKYDKLLFQFWQLNLQLIMQLYSFLKS